jgi:hypothetical protein
MMLSYLGLYGGDPPFQVERFHGLAMVLQDRGSGLGFLCRQDAAGHGVGDGGQRLYQISGTDDRRQIEPNAPAAAARGDDRAPAGPPSCRLPWRR